jgi:CDP-diacylglycerol---glycerol-3-phosphate 3-phosphatidyltransferase
MLSAHLRIPVSRVVDPVARGLLRLGLTPNTVTVIGTLGVSLSAVIFYPRGELFWGTIAITAFVFSDLLDGTMARLSQRVSVWGAFVDSTLDRVADAAVFGALLLFYMENDPVLALLALVSLLAGNLVSYVKARAESLGLTCSGGIAERAERLIVVLVTTGFAGLGVPYIAAIGLWLLAVTSIFTLGQRMAQVWRQR